MARGTEFNQKKVLEKATKLFWKEGYKKASVQSLMKSMGLRESSFYNTFGSKRELYLKCLEHYNSSTTFRRTEALSSPKPIQDRIQDFFEIIFNEMSVKGRVHGCLMTNSLSYEVLKDQKLKTYVLNEMSKFKEFLIQSFEEAKRANEIPKSFNSEECAALIVTFLQGLFKISITTTDVDSLRRQTSILLMAIGLDKKN